jgi:hypothetical protein
MLDGPLKLYTKVFVIESPSADDLAKGVDESKKLSAAFTNSGIPHDLYVVSDLRTFQEVLRQIAEEVVVIRKTIGAVTLHLSMHGNEHCIGLTSNEKVYWEQLAGMLREFMYTITPMYQKGWKTSPVTICFSSCEGLHATAVNNFAEPDESLFQFLVGPVSPVTWTQAANAFIAFHEHTLNVDGVGLGPEALKKMNDAAGLVDVFQGQLGKGMGWVG